MVDKLNLIITLKKSLIHSKTIQKSKTRKENAIQSNF